MSSIDADWQLIKDEPIKNTVFDVIAKYYDPIGDQFLMQRFSNCIQVEGVVMWSNPFKKFFEPPGIYRETIKLVEWGFRPTHWMPSPSGPKDFDNV